MGLFANMAKYVFAVGSFSVVMPQVVKYTESVRIARTLEAYDGAVERATLRAAGGGASHHHH